MTSIKRSIIGVAICTPMGEMVTLLKPKRHDHILQLMRSSGFTLEEICYATSGFIDNLGNFVYRDDAMKLVRSNGQLKGVTYNKYNLFSEDLW